jgi:UPF0271 protein
MLRIDLNCDLGEGAGLDAELMPLVTSANIACGAHAGDAATMRETVALARRHGVGIGAHPGHEDRAGFGRAERTITGAQAAGLVTEQIARLAAIAGGDLRHVKLHGALYNQVAREPRLAEAVAGELARTWPRLVVFALAGSELVRAGRRHGLVVAEEAFADRRYRRDGSLVPRAWAGATIDREDEAVAQALAMITRGALRAIEGGETTVRADTLCLHGDGPHAAAFARRLRQEFAAAGIAVRAFAAD